MSYVVLARRWRSQHFDEVVGQEHVARTLCNAIEQDRVAHAFLFCGPRGVGKTSTARILAKALNCAQGPTTKPCYACPSCLEISEGSSMDVFEIDGASNRGVGEIRELREGVRYAPSRDRYKIYIIDEVHMLTTEAFNALLKTLEEPPPHVKFIFATTEPQKIPVTILSRCQRFDFKRISARRITEHLEQITKAEGLEAETKALTLIARQADGCMRDALSLTDQVISFCEGKLSEVQVAEVLGVAGRDVLFDLTAALFTRQVEQSLRVLDRVNSAGYDLMHFISALVEHLRDLTVIKVSQDPSGLIDLVDHEIALAREQLERVDISVLNRMFNICVQAAESMSRSAYPKLVFEMTLVKLSAIEPIQPLELLLGRLEALESGIFMGGPGSGGAPPSMGPGGAPPGRSQGPASAAASGSQSTAGPEHTAAPHIATAQHTPERRPAPETLQPAEAKPQNPPVAPTLPDTEPTIIPLRKGNLPPRPEAFKQEGDIPLPAPRSPEKIPTNGTPHPKGVTNGTATNHLRLVAEEDGGAVTTLAVVAASGDAEATPETTAVVDLDTPTITSAEAKPDAANTSSAEAASTEAASAETTSAEETSAEAASTSDAAAAPDSARELWRAVVNRLKSAGKHVPAGIYEQAQILNVDRDAGEIHIRFDAGLDSIAKAHLHTIEQAAADALPDTTWTINAEFVEANTDDVENAQRSLAQEQDEIHRAQLAEARELIAAHDLVNQAITIFSPEKTWIILDEDDHFSNPAR